jgi:hypothetical protein
MAITVYTYGRKSFPLITPSTFVPLYSQHWHDFAKYKDTTLYLQAVTPLRTMVSRIKKTPGGFISSDIEIKKILDILGSSFIANYNTYGFSVSCPAMLGMQLFEFCVFDVGYNWWYFVPKPILNGHLLSHSHYHL